MLLPLSLLSQGARAQNGQTATPPPTTQQAPLPNPALPLPQANHPLLASPGAATLTGRFLTQPLTINDVVAIALATNRSLALEVEAYMEAQGTTVTARAGLGPSASATYAFTRYNEEIASNFGGQTVVTQPQYVNQVTAALSLPIDIAGELHAAASQAKFQEIAARLEINRVRNQIVLDTKSAFYTVLRDQALVKVAQDSLQNAVDRLSDAQLRLDAGTVTRYDVTTARTNVANAQLALIKARNTLSQAFSALNNTIGIDIHTPLQLTTTGAVEVPTGDVTNPAPGIKPSPPPENNLNVKPGELLGDKGATQADKLQDFSVANPIAPDAEFDRLLKETLGMRPEILREDANIAAARKGITVARTGLLPTVKVGYNLNYAPDTGTFAGQPLTGYVGVNVNIPFYDSGATRGQVMKARGLVSTAETNRRDQVDTITLELRQAYLNLQQANDAVRVARQELAQADESYRLARLRYSAGVTSQAGVSPLLEVSNAQQALSQAQSDYVNALYDFNNDRSALDKAIGRYSYTPGPLGFAAPPSAKMVGRPQSK
jgi:outer membrane protein